MTNYVIVLAFVIGAVASILGRGEINRGIEGGFGDSMLGAVLSFFGLVVCIICAALVAHEAFNAYRSLQL